MDKNILGDFEICISVPLMLKALVMIFKTYLGLRSKSIFLLVGFDQNVTNVDSVDIQNSTLTE